MKSKMDDIICKTVRMPRYRLNQLKMIAHIQQISTMKLINDILKDYVDCNEGAIQSFNELCDMYPDEEV